MRQLSVCLKCLSKGHAQFVCNSMYRCRVCSDKHHTHLHWESSKATKTPDTEARSALSAKCRLSQFKCETCVLPSTAFTLTTAGRLSLKARAVLDSGAMISMVLSKLANYLRAPRIKDSTIHITGVGGQILSPYMVELSLSSTHAGAAEQITIQAHVVDQIPKTSVAMGMDRIYRLEFMQGLPLAYPEFSNTSKVDLLLGQAHTVRCELRGSAYSKEGDLKDQRTIFGWTVGGSINDSSLQPNPA